MISFFSRLLDTISPRPCAICGDRLGASEQVLCARCNLNLPRTGFALHPKDNAMSRLFEHLLPIERCAALMFHSGGSQASRVVYDMKYFDRPEYAVEMGRMMAEEFAPTGFFEGIDLIIPVPLTRRRIRQRGYNQSEKLAQGVSEITGIAVEKHAVKRIKFSETQTHKDRWQRTDNVEGAFSLANPARVSGKHVLIVDDVVTSGATVLACATQIVKAGNVKISVLSLSFAKSST